MNPRLERNIIEEIKIAAATVFGDEVPVDITVEGASFYLDSPAWRRPYSPAYPGEQPCEDILGEVSYETWTAHVADRVITFNNAATELQNQLPGMSITVSCDFEGPQHPEHPPGWVNDYFIDVPQGYRIIP